LKAAIDEGKFFTAARLEGVFVDKGNVTQLRWEGSSNQASLKAHEELHITIAEVAAKRENQMLARIEKAFTEGGSAASAIAETKAVFKHSDRIDNFVQSQYDFQTGHGTYPRQQNRWKRDGAVERAFDRAEKILDRNINRFKRLESRYTSAPKITGAK